MNNDQQAGQSRQSQSQSAGGQSQSQGQSQGAGQRSAIGASGHEVPDGQASYGNSQDDQGESDSDQASPDAETADLAKRDKVTAAEAALGGKAVPGEVSPRPDEQARTDANPQLYDG